MLSKITSILVLMMTVQSFAQNESEKKVEVSGQTISLVKARQSSGRVVSGRLKETSDIKFGENTLKAVPANTSVQFSLNADGESYINLMVFSKDFPVQKWMADGVELSLNCSRYGAEQNYRARVVTFHENLQMNGRCTVDEASEIKTPSGDEVVLAKGALLFLTENGRLKSATKIQEGAISVLGQTVLLRANTSLDFNSRGGVHFFYMADGESFVAPTDLSEETLFEQKEGEQGRPFLFYGNGVVESGYVRLQTPVQKTVRIFEQEHALNVLGGPMGFSDSGRLDRFILGERLDFVAGVNVKIYFIEAESRQANQGSLKSGDTLPLNQGTNLFLTTDADGESRLEGFPIVIQGKLYFLSLTSAEPLSLLKQ